MRLPPRTTILDPDPDDTRLPRVEDGPEAWADGDVLTIAARMSGRLYGTFAEELRPAGDGVWAVRIRVRGLARACVDYRLWEPGVAVRTWRGPQAPPPAPHADVAATPPETLGGDELARTHPVALWLPPAAPRAVAICADDEGLAWLAGYVAAAREPVALVGIGSGAVQHRWGEEYEYAIDADPRARAYLRHVDPPYFDAHMRYVVETVLPWADARIGRRLPRLAFGVSNGACWAAAAGVLHPESFVGVAAFSPGSALADLPRQAGGPSFALAAGRLEPGFDRATTTFARRLRSHGMRVRLRRPLRGHDASMCGDELVPALRWLLER